MQYVWVSGTIPVIFKSAKWNQRKAKIKNIYLHPNQRQKVPRNCNATLCGGNSLGSSKGFPFSSWKRPLRGPKIMALAKAVTPPTMWTGPLPACRSNLWFQKDEFSSGVYLIHKKISYAVSKTYQVDGSAPPKRIGSIGREPSRGRPKGVRDDGVTESHQNNRIQQIGLHLRTLGNCTSHNGAKRTSESKLEEPVLEGNVIVVLEEEPAIANKCLAGIIRSVSSVGQGVPAHPKGNTATTRVEKIPQDDVFDILGTDATSTKHGKTSLHKVHEGTRKDEVEGIDATGKTTCFLRDLLEKDTHKSSEIKVGE